MPAGFPCPNPTCAHTFAPDAVRGRASLACPRCGTVYQFRNEQPRAKPAPPPPPPPPAPMPPPPPTPAVKPAVPIAAPVRERGGPQRHLELESSPDVVLSPRSRRRGSWVPLLVGLGLFLGLSGVGAFGVWYIVSSLPVEEGDTSPRAQRILGNFSFQQPRGWKPDGELHLQMGVNLFLVRNRPRHFAALRYYDYKTRTPSDAELLDTALRILRGEVTKSKTASPLFVTLEYEDPFKGKDNGRTGTLDGEPAIVMNFLARDQQEVMMRGEVYMLTRQGFGYWIFTWGPDEYHEQIRGEWETLRERFAFANQRDGWKPTPRQMEPIALPDLGAQISYAKDLWRVEETPKDYDDKAMVVLKGFEPSEEDDSGKKRTVAHAGKMATIQLLRLAESKSAEEAATAAVAHVEAKQKQLYPMIKLEPLTDSKTGKLLAGVEVGALRGQVKRYKMLLDADTSRYLVLAVAPLPGGTLVLVCESPFSRREFWEQEFRGVIETARRPKAK